ncbi:hypothetical protein NEMBOFW57_001795 [Staphylotrichum longicolle]|uniref:Uncharacterized protein n=1 Tax=Staphylotrichum longicolle TaxID=669026 RepID=A0AAD4F2I3_9PEZI|nr:hypothetical protein NEMBOFW57_001795 [Staphylotrichum longicolle]
MANCTIYTRAYSALSPRRLTSGKGATGPPLAPGKLLAEFKQHRRHKEKVATALVSVSDRIVDTISRALDLHHTDDVPIQDIWIAFIKVPDAENKHTKTSARTHRAEDLAKKLKLPNSILFRYEIVFEWAIPEEWVTHQVSLQTLIKRWRKGGLMEHVLDSLEPLDPLESLDPWDFGAALAYFAEAFGARAPSEWIAHRVFYDCVQFDLELFSYQWVMFEFPGGRRETEDFGFFCALDKGIKDALEDWLNDDFASEYQNFEAWRRGVEDDMSRDWVHFWEEWQEEEGKPAYAKALNELMEEHEAIQNGIEEEAVEIGL